jgi:Flp pilus assembly protein TadB
MTIFQFVSSLTTGLLIIAGLFILLGIRSTDMTQQLFSKLRQKQKRKRMIQRLAGKKPGTLKRKISEAKWMLDSAGMGEHISTYRWLSVILGLLGLIFGLLLDNSLAALVLSVGLALMPLVIIRIRTAEYIRGQNARLETVMGIITNAYLQSGDLIAAIRDNLRLLPAPLDKLFGGFLVETQFIDANLIRAIQLMRSRINNRYWRDWCSVLIQCQHDRQLRYALPGIVERLGESRRAQMEIDTTIQKHFGDYLITVLIVLGSIPLMGFMMPDWYDMLMQSLPGKITLSVILGAILLTAVWVAGVYRPVDQSGDGDVLC